jgi:tellurite resistance protein TerA
MELQQGANTSVGGGVLQISVELSAPSGCDVDVSAYLLTESGRVRDDNDMVFYNQPAGGDGAVRLADRSAAGTTFDVDAARLPCGDHEIGVLRHHR